MSYSYLQHYNKKYCGLDSSALKPTGLCGLIIYFWPCIVGGSYMRQKPAYPCSVTQQPTNINTLLSKVEIVKIKISFLSTNVGHILKRVSQYLFKCTQFIWRLSLFLPCQTYRFSPRLACLLLFCFGGQFCKIQARNSELSSLRTNLLWNCSLIWFWSVFKAKTVSYGSLLTRSTLSQDERKCSLRHSLLPHWCKSKGLY